MGDSLFELLQPARLTAVVDIGANPIDGEPPYKRMLQAGLCTVCGFEPQADALAKLARQKGSLERYLPAAIGDGRYHTLHVCRARGMTSLLTPDRSQLALFNEFTEFGHVEAEFRIPTKRLDDVEEITAMDLLKIDVQGGELEVFHSGTNKLAKAVAVQTEVSFVGLYKNQPTLGAVDSALRELGFVPHCFAEIKRWPIAPLVIGGDARRPLRQVLEADLVYVRDFARPDAMDGEQWKHLALVAHHCYDSFDLALHAIGQATRLGALPATAVAQYLEILQADAERETQRLEPDEASSVA
ncbi:MAG: FkbM family methyltransferase [Vicinamibacterales bacterium]